MEIEAFHSDNGGEFTSDTYKQTITESGAKKTTIIANTPNMNPVAEGAFWRIFCIVRALLKDAGLPNNMWAHAFTHALYLLNRLPTKRDGKWTTPYELVMGRKPNVAHLRLFGCLCHALIVKEQRDGKLGDVAQTGFNLGISRHKRGWIVFIPSTGKTIVSRTVRFEERVMYKDASKIPGVLPLPNAEDDSDDEDEFEIVANDGSGPAIRAGRQCATPGCQQRTWHLGPCGPMPNRLPDTALPSARTRSQNTAAHQIRHQPHHENEIEDLSTFANPEWNIDTVQYTAMRACGFAAETAHAFAVACATNAQLKTLRDKDGKISQKGSLAASKKQ